MHLFPLCMNLSLLNIRLYAQSVELSEEKLGGRRLTTVDRVMPTFRRKLRPTTGTTRLDGSVASNSSADARCLNLDGGIGRAQRRSI